MKLFVTGLLFIVILFACSLPDMGCDDHSCDGCWYVLKEHAEKMIYYLSVKCPYDSACYATLVINWAAPKDENECKLDDFEYTLISGSVRKKMQRNTILNYLPVSSDDHLRFSLLDSAKVEKKYDIDLSNIVHSYTIEGDSIRITLPDNLTYFSIECPYCLDNTNDVYMCNFAYECVREDEYGNSTMTARLDPSWRRFYVMSYWLDSQGPTQKDSIEVIAYVYFRE